MAKRARKVSDGQLLVYCAELRLADLPITIAAVAARFDVCRNTASVWMRGLVADGRLYRRSTGPRDRATHYTLTAPHSRPALSLRNAAIDARSAAAYGAARYSDADGGDARLAARSHYRAPARRLVISFFIRDLQ